MKKGHPWWMKGIDSAFERADELGRNDLLLVPMFIGEQVVYAYHASEQGRLRLEKRRSRHDSLPARWAGKDVKYMYVYGKLVPSPKGRKELIALGVLVNGELSFNQHRNQLLELNLLSQAGFKTPLPYAKSFSMDGLTYVAIMEHWKNVREAVNQHRASIWSDSTHGWFPEPVGLQAFPV